MTRIILGTRLASLTFAALAFSAAGFPAQVQAGQIAGRQPAAVATQQVPTLKNNIPSGSIITQEDIALVDLPAQQISGNIITNPQNLVGMAAAYPLSANRPIRNTDVRPPILTKKGSLVTMTVATPNMVLTATGRALENGSLGNSIRIQNTSTNKIVEGVVMADGNINVSRGIRTAALQN